jgi:asparagine synthase (glutamine-hydrolysing)
MGALLGISGPSSPGLPKTLAHPLCHRGTRFRFLDESASGTLGLLCDFDSKRRSELGTGLFAEDDRAIVLDGYLTNRPPPAPRDLLREYVERGIGFIERLRGAFVMVVRDKTRFFLVRDGAGARTLYYSLFQNRLFFSVEPKGIHRLPGFSRKIRPGAVAQYLSFSFIPGHRTMLKNLFEVPAGSYAYYDSSLPAKGIVLKRHFHFEDDTRRNGHDEQYWIERFRKEFRSSVRERIPDGEPVAATLSGGIDSSVVVSELSRLGRKVKTFSLHFGKEYDNELEFARLVAERCGTDHEEVLIRPGDFLPRFRKMIWHLDDPIGDPITMPNFELASRMSGDFRWVFNGEGGDPLFGGPKNYSMLLRHWYGGIDRHPRFRERSYLASYRRGFEELDRLLTPGWLSAFDAGEELEGVLAPFFESALPRKFLNKLMAINIRLKGAHLILPKVERMTAAWGLNALSPLFDERLFRLSFEMPPRLKLADGVEKVIFKRCYRNDLPSRIIERPKSGMRVPVYFWFQKEMKKYARHLLSPKNIRKAGIFNPERVRQLLDYSTVEGPGRYGMRLWMLVTFEVWRRIVVEGEPV